MTQKFDTYGPYILLSLLFITSALLRPALPIDETRYLTVAWEMFLQKKYAVLSLNFQPYHHKPPMLFWIINASWEIFGVSRLTALIPIFFSSALVIFFTQRVSKLLTPEKPSISQTVPWVLIGSFPFLIYSTLIMFDLMLTAFILAALTLFLEYSKTPKIYKPICAGIFIGLGFLVKGPVIYLYTLWPLVLYRFWREEGAISPCQFYKSLFLAFLISLVPVLTWLLPVLSQTSDDFAVWLIWNQTAGRVIGNFNSAHVRPAFFYVMILPLLFLPWCFLRSFWKNIRELPANKSYKFLMSAIIPTFLSFCLIAGKQPHYLLPLVPFFVVVITLMLDEKKQVTFLSLGMISIFLISNIVASLTVFHNYDLLPVSQYYNSDRHADWAFVRKYQGEIGFLARVDKPIESIERNQLEDWFKQHPEGKAIVRYNLKDDMSGYVELFSQPYKGKYIGIFKEM